MELMLPWLMSLPIVFTPCRFKFSPPGISASFPPAALPVVAPDLLEPIDPDDIEEADELDILELLPLLILDWDE
jgi:hypothetical protein